MSYYFHSDWSINTTPGGVKLPTILVLALVPMMGALFLMFLPLIGFVLCVQALALKARSIAIELVASMAGNVAVGEAHLTGSPPKSEGSDVLADLQNEIENLRK